MTVIVAVVVAFAGRGGGSGSVSSSGIRSGTTHGTGSDRGSGSGGSGILVVVHGSGLRKPREIVVKIYANKTVPIYNTQKRCT